MNLEAISILVGSNGDTIGAKFNGEKWRHKIKKCNH